MSQLFIVVPKQSNVSIGAFNENNALVSIQPANPIQLQKPLTSVLENNNVSIMNMPPYFCDWGFWGRGYVICKDGDFPGN